MFLNKNLNKLLIIGFLVEALIFVFFYQITDNWGEIFRLSARYSGRLSLIIYLICFYHFTFSFIKKNSSEKLNNSIIIFCFLHFIHFIFLLPGLEDKIFLPTTQQQSIDYQYCTIIIYHCNCIIYIIIIIIYYLMLSTLI